MSNIAVPRRTERTQAAAIDWLRFLRLVLAAAILTALLVSFTPFTQEFDSTDGSGSVVNQLGYSTLGVIAIAGHLLFTDRRVAWSFLRPGWLLMVAVLVFAALQSRWPDPAMRALLFSFTTMIAATGALTLPTSVKDFRTVLIVAALAVLGLSYAGIVLYPVAAIHQASGPEAQHAGLWRGIYAHKNLAGPVMAMLLFVGLYLMRCGQRWTGLLIAVLSAFFVYKTGSKTALGLVPIVFGIIVGGRLFGGRVLPVVILSAALVVIACLTLGSAISPVLDQILQTVMPGTTFTGRLDLWRFAVDELRAHPWNGFGYLSFWDTPNVFAAELPFELSWDPRGIVNSHSGYLDLAMWAGWPALVPMLLVLVAMPFKDFVSTVPGVENQRLADLFLTILAFALLNSFLETFFFDRGNPIWMLTWLSMVGLHLCGRFRLD